MRRHLIVLGLATITCVTCSIASADLLSVYALSDRSAVDRTDIDSGTLEDGLFDTFFEDFDPYLRTYNSRALWESRSALVFDVSSVPSDAQITSAALFLQTTALVRAEFGATTLIVDGYSAESVVQLSDFSAFNPIGSVDLPRPLELPPLTVDATSFLQSLQDVGAFFAGFTLRTVPGATIHFASNEWSISKSRPRLDIEYETVAVPEPSVALLAAVGAAICGLCYVVRLLLRRLCSG
jgi:hypothetical protein